jgi:Domain of unknown function (DUF4345)
MLPPTHENSSLLARGGRGLLWWRRSDAKVSRRTRVSTSSSRARRVRLIAGLSLAAGGLVLALSPLQVAAVLGRAHDTSPQMINLRASWGGSVLGLGAFIAWLESVRPWRRFALALLMWTMIGIGLARALGFALDGGPDTLQWVWLSAEIALATGAALALRSRAARGASDPDA